MKRKMDQCKMERRSKTFRNIRMTEKITDPKRTEKELRKYKTLFSKIHDLAYICDNKGNILYINETFERFTGYKVKEFIGKPFAPLFDAENQQIAQENYARTLAGESPQFELTFKDTGIICEYINHQLKDEKDNIIGVMGIARDISKQKQAEKKLAEYRSHLEDLVKERTAELTKINALLTKEVTERKRMEENLLREKKFSETAINSLPGIFYLLDRHGNILRHNKNNEKVTGYSYEEILKLNALDMIAEEDRGNIAERIEEVLEKGEATQEANLLIKDGKKIPYLFTGKNMEMDNEKYIVGMGIDLAERKRAEETLRNTNAFLSSLVESPADIIIVAVDKDYNYTFFNTAHKKEMKIVWGVDIEIGKNLLSYIPSKDERDRVKNNFEQVLTGKRFIKEEAYGEGESRFWYELAYNPIFDEIKNITGVTVFITNISDRKKAENELSIYQNRLQSLASELSLTEERERRHIATDLHDHIGQCLAISQIKLKALREKVASSDFAQPFKEIQQLINQAIQYTRSLMFELSPPMLYELGLESAVEWLIEETGKRHGVTTSFQDDKYPKPLDDEVRLVLFQGVRELLVNTSKHGQANNMQVSIQKDGHNIRIDVEDDGVGFDTSKTTSYENKTGGFGLFNLRERLAYLGGSLQIGSEPGKGTRATLVAPLKRGKTIPKD